MKKPSNKNTVDTKPKKPTAPKAAPKTKLKGNNLSNVNGSKRSK